MGIDLEFMRNLAVGTFGVCKDAAITVMHSETARKVGQKVAVTAAGFATTLGLKKLTNGQLKNKPNEKVSSGRGLSKEDTEEVIRVIG